MNSLPQIPLRFAFATVVVALFSTTLFLPPSLLARESTGAFITNKPDLRNVSLPVRHSHQQISSIDTGAFFFVDTGRALAFNNDLRVTDTRRDITSVGVVPVTMSDAGVPSGRENYWEMAETNTAVLSRDSGKTNIHLRSAGQVTDVSSSYACERTGSSLITDDFLGHTREYLLTRK